MKIYLPLLVLLGHSLSIYAQSAIVATATGSNSNTQVVIDWTLGEIVTETHMGSNIFLENGLTATASNFVITSDLVVDPSVISVFPLPFANELNVSIPEGRLFEYSFFDVNGKRLIVKSEQYNSVILIETTALPTGVYFITIYDKTFKQSSTFKLTKQ